MIENKYNETKRWLLSYLAEREGTAYVSAIFADANTVGLNKYTLRAVKEVLPIEVHRKGFGKGSRVYWALKTNAPIISIAPHTPLAL